MGFFKRLFSKKAEQEVEPGVLNEEVQELEQTHSESDVVCRYCNLLIQGEQRLKTFGGHKYHLKPCWRSLRKDAIDVSRGNALLPTQK